MSISLSPPAAGHSGGDQPRLGAAHLQLLSAELHLDPLRERAAAGVALHARQHPQDPDVPGLKLAIRLQRSPLRMTFAGTSVQTRIRRAILVQRLTRPMVFTSRWPGISVVSDTLTLMTTQGGGWGGG